MIDYTKTAPEEVLRDLDVVLDPRGGDDFARLLRTLRPNGIIVTLKGKAPGTEERATRHGVRVGYTYVAPNGTLLAEMATMLANGDLTIAVERTFAFTDIAAAHRIGEEGHVRGRLVIDLSS